MQSQQQPFFNQTDFSALPKEILFQAAFSLIENTLGNFRAYLTATYPDDNLTILEEDFFNEQLARRLQTEQTEKQPKVKFEIVPQSSPPSAYLQRAKQKSKPKGMPRKIDIHFFLPGAPNIFMAVEGKRLHLSCGNQYVSGDTGGIARFKRNEHGANTLKAAMIGYMQTDAFEFWHKKVNDWIDAEARKEITPLFWTAVDKLRNQTIAPDGNWSLSLSQNTRIDSIAIELRHYWVTLT